jgi:hypothetical protein
MSLHERTRPVGTIEPYLASPAKTPPSGPDWLHESSMTVFAFHRDSAGVRLITRARSDFARSLRMTGALSRCRKRARSDEQEKLWRLQPLLQAFVHH